MSLVCWGTHCLNLMKLPQMLLCLRLTALGGSSCFAAGLGAGTGALGFKAGHFPVDFDSIDLRFLAQWQ